MAGSAARGLILLLQRAGLGLLLLALGGCASSPYRYGVDPAMAPADKYPPMAQQVYQGAPHAVLDAADWYWPPSLLGKLLLWNADVDSHEISPETLSTLQTYLDCNGLDHVQVLANRYAPGNQWLRLFRNRTVGAGWRYTLGVLSVALYSALPGRFFGGDAYSAYTNTIFLYSDDPAIALHEGGHAKDFARRKYKGLNAAIYALPFAALYYEAEATREALGYAQAQADAQLLREGYHSLYPAYATYVGGSVSRWTPWSAAGVIPGHIAGRWAAAAVPESLEDRVLFEAATPELVSRLQTVPGCPWSVSSPESAEEMHSLPQAPEGDTSVQSPPAGL